MTHDPNAQRKRQKKNSGCEKIENSKIVFVIVSDSFLSMPGAYQKKYEEPRLVINNSRFC